MTTRRGVPSAGRGSGVIPTGFISLDTDDLLRPKQRLIISSSGQPKSGKSHWALASGPEPIFHIMMDPNAKEIHKKIKRELQREMYLADFPSSRGLTQVTATAVWAKFREFIDGVLDYGHGTLVVDSATDMKEVAQLVYVGDNPRLPQNERAKRYGNMNDELTDALRAIYNTDLTAVFIHQLSKEYRGDSWDGRSWRLDGWAKMPYEVQCNVRMERNKEGVYLIRVQENNMANWMDGQVYEVEGDGMGLQGLLDLTFS